MNNLENFIFNSFFLRKYFFKKLLKKIVSIKLIIFDVDGVLTDGSILISEDGVVSKKFNVKDGLGIKILLKEGFKVVFMSGSNSHSIKIRAKQLGITKCIIDAKNKVMEIKKLKIEFGLQEYEIAYVGDDLNDLKVKQNVSLFISPKDAVSEIRNQSDIILQSKGGYGVAREVVKILLSVNQRIAFYKSFGWVDSNDA